MEKEILSLCQAVEKLIVSLGYVGPITGKPATIGERLKALGDRIPQPLNEKLRRHLRNRNKFVHEGELIDSVAEWLVLGNECIKGLTELSGSGPAASTRDPKRLRDAFRARKARDCAEPDLFHYADNAAPKDSQLEDAYQWQPDPTHHLHIVQKRQAQPMLEPDLFRYADNTTPEDSQLEDADQWQPDPMSSVGASFTSSVAPPAPEADVANATDDVSPDVKQPRFKQDQAPAGSRTDDKPFPLPDADSVTTAAIVGAGVALVAGVAVFLMR